MNKKKKNELYHYGVKGMRWGVRKAYKEDKKQYEKEEYDRLYKERNIEGKKKKVYDYGIKNKLDLDDGGGGDPRAGEKYVDMWDKVSALEMKTYNDAKDYAEKRLIEKYGKETVSAFKKRQTAAKQARVSALLATLAAFSIGTFAYVGKRIFEN